jgi:hypothetical protein
VKGIRIVREFIPCGWVEGDLIEKLGHGLFVGLNDTAYASDMF